MASELAVALAKLQTQLPHIGKTAKGTIRNGKADRYATLTDVSKAIMPLLGGLGLSFIACPTLLDGQLVLKYELLHVAGGREGGVYPLGTGSPQQLGSAITYARRYCLCAVTGVAPDDDDDDAAAAEQSLPAQTRARVTGAEHERLRNGTVEPTPGDRRAQRVGNSAEPPGDMWTGAGPPCTCTRERESQDTCPTHSKEATPSYVTNARAKAIRGQGPMSPLGNAPLEVVRDAFGQPAEDQPGSISKQQQAKMWALFGRLGIPKDDRAGRMGLTIAVIGRDVESSSDLSWQEGARLLDELDRRAKAQNGAAK